jgi:quercetin dioxygenase-like cupin family protein
MSERTDTLVRTAETAWTTARTPGISIKVLRDDKASGASTVLLRLEPGARVAAHNHPGGEELFVLEGDFQVGPHRLTRGDYLYTPPDGKHAASTEGGCLVLVSLPRPVEFLTQQPMR